MTDSRLVWMVVLIVAALAAVRRRRLGPMPGQPRDASSPTSRATSRHRLYRVLYSVALGLLAITLLNDRADETPGETAAMRGIIVILGAAAYAKMRQYARLSAQGL